MMTTLSSYFRRARHVLRRLSLDPRIHALLRWGGWLLMGWSLSAASLRHVSLPLAMGLVLTLSGWPAVLAALGACGGYLLFWQTHGLQGVVWTALGLVGALFGNTKTVRQQPLLIPAMGGLIVAVVGLAFQFLALSNARLGVYLLRILVGAGAAWVFTSAREHRDPVTDWLISAFVVLSLAQIFGLGYGLAGVLGTAAAFPAAALAGLALDMALVTPVPMTAVLCLLYLLRLIPWHSPWVVRLAPGAVHALVCALTGVWDLSPLPMLILGGILGQFLPEQQKIIRRRGQTGVA